MCIGTNCNRTVCTVPAGHCAITDGYGIVAMAESIRAYRNCILTDGAGLKTHCHAVDIACIGAGAQGYCTDVIGMSNRTDGYTAFVSAAGCHRIATNRYRFRGDSAGIVADGNAFFPVCSGVVTDGNDIFTRLITCGILIAHTACVMANHNGMTCRCKRTRTDCNRIVENACFGIAVNFWLDTRLRTDGNTI